MDLDYRSGDESLTRFFFLNGEVIDTYYGKGEAFGRFVALKSELVFPSSPMFEEYEYVGQGYTSEEFAALYSRCMDDTLMVAQNQMLATIGLSLSSFGVSM